MKGLIKDLNLVLVNKKRLFFVIVVFVSSEYKTIQNDVAAELVEKRSRFVANLSFVETKSAAVSFCASVKKAHHGASHNVYAYVLGTGEIKSSDDGEPSGTAGRPVLEVLKNNGLVNVIAVVSRYFGGILLGKGGLVRAYSGVVLKALSLTKIVKMTFCSYCKVICPYDLYNQILNLVVSFGACVCSKQFSDVVSLFFYISVRQAKVLEQKINETFKVKFNVLENKFFNLDAKQCV